ncbi:MAG TPA: HD domain-containing phosphohydrolase [Magnetospirillum sp.]|nr:HD domain-containing phosphohydrolase [Magnetospirillum sp.]
MKTKFHRRLALRLFAGGVLIAAVLGGAVLWMDVENVDEAVLDMGTAEAKQIAPRLPDDLNALGPAERAEIDHELEKFVTKRAQRHGGHFVIAEIYDLNQKSVADAVAQDVEKVEDAVDLSIHHYPSDGNHWYAKHLIEGQLYLQLVVPLTDDHGHQIGWFEGVFRIPRETVVQVIRASLHATALVVLAVLATSALLYPLMASLNAGLVARSRELLRANLGTLEALGSAIAKRDSDTNAHNYRVTLYAVRLAEAIGLADAEIRALIKGAFLHDVGKIAIPDAVLLKPGKLDADEFAVMRTHVAHGLDIVSQFEWLGDAAAVVGGHHEKVDGSGYPAGNAGDAIPLIARIFAIADVFDALTSRRPYKEPFPQERALAILDEGAGSHFDAQLVATFRTLAPALHGRLSESTDAALQDELRQLTHAYFTEEI